MAAALVKQEKCTDEDVKSLLLATLRENNVGTSSTQTTTVYVNTRKEIYSECTKEAHPACFEEATAVQCFQVKVERGRISFRESCMHPTLSMHAVQMFVPLFLRLDGITPSELAFYIIKRAVEAQNVGSLVKDERIHHLQNHIALGKTTVYKSVEVLTEEAQNLTPEQLTRLEIVTDVVAQAVHVSSKFSRLLRDDSVSSAFQFVAHYLDAQLKSSMLKSVWMEVNNTIPFVALYNKAIGDVFAFMMWIQTNMSLHLLESNALQLSDATLGTAESFQYLARRFTKLGAVAWFASLSVCTQRDVLDAYHTRDSLPKYI